MILFFSSVVLVNGIEFALRPRSRPENSGDWTLFFILGMTLATAAGSVVTAENHVAPLPGNPWLWVIAGLVVLWAAFAFRMWAIVALGRFFQVTVVVQDGHRVVENGPYRWIRHPGYLGAILGLVGAGIAEGDWASIAIMLVGGFAAFFIRIRVEERVLLAKLGDDYAAFAKRRARLVPGLF
jgi:protein-S-isoprenylcysteine O-methyltransferase Ste14